MGIAYSIQGDYYTALKHFLRARDIYDSIKDERRVAQAISYCASVYQDLGQIEKSLNTRAAAVPIQQKLNDKRGLGFSYFNIALLYQSSDRIDSAKYYFKRSHELFQEIILLKNK